MAKTFTALRQSLATQDTWTARLAAAILATSIADIERSDIPLHGRKISGCDSPRGSAEAVLDAMDFLSDPERWEPWCRIAGLTPVEFAGIVEHHTTEWEESQERELKKMAESDA